ncbi:glycosyltransferase [Pontibacter sp. E15-1]|uniref:glycosyltransferase family 2 protein n=1 Tax=Pontibacter sp. E15-1 TaxID=2919918 RepID=UPI001F4F60B8|nr:glycosyltransferase [Pontibacter sp. E15-1]MCJ8165336.1 glycosyltransferase [Pontibacter sp. E15-1]
MSCRTLSSPPQILPIGPEVVNRPLWSVMIPVYNCAHYLKETLQSVLQQQISEETMQIEVVDDASTDADVEALVAAIGKGRVKYYRQAENVGSLRNFETCLNRAQGKLLHILHGDDKVRDGYYATMQQLFKRYPDAGAAFCRFNYIDHTGADLFMQRREMREEGILEGWLQKIAERQRIQYAAITIRREVYEKLGGFYALTYGEDWEMWTRIAREYPVAYTPTVLADYRKHATSISGEKYLTGQYLQDLAQAMELIQHHLPQDQRKAILKKSRTYYAHYGIKIANQLWRRLHSRQLVQVQVTQALRLYKTPHLYYKIAQVYAKILLHTLWKTV